MIQHINCLPELRTVTITSALLLSACSFKFELTSQKTALENQIMGNYRELEDDLIVTNFEKTSKDIEVKSQRKSLASVELERAQKNREFNADDIKELKDSGIIGETSDGSVGLLPKSLGGVAQASPEQIKLAEALIDEENRDRGIIWKSSITEESKSKDSEESQIRTNFARDIFEKSPTGHWFNVGNRWTVKQ